MRVLVTAINLVEVYTELLPSLGSEFWLKKLKKWPVLKKYIQLS